MADDFSALVRFAGGAYAVVTQTLAGFEHHQVVEVVGAEGSARAWWSGAMDRTREPAFDLRVKRRGREAPDPSRWRPRASCSSWRRRSGRPSPPSATPAAGVGRGARKRIVVCLEAERSLREGREIALRF